eukprot:4759877-Amphidinium_carterae.1
MKIVRLGVIEGQVQSIHETTDSDEIKVLEKKIADACEQASMVRKAVQGGLSDYRKSCIAKQKETSRAALKDMEKSTEADGDAH